MPLKAKLRGDGDQLRKVKQYSSGRNLLVPRDKRYVGDGVLVADEPDTSSTSHYTANHQYRGTGYDAPLLVAQSGLKDADDTLDFVRVTLDSARDLLRMEELKPRSLTVVRTLPCWRKVELARVSTLEMDTAYRKLGRLQRQDEQSTSPWKRSAETIWYEAAEYAQSHCSVTNLSSFDSTLILFSGS